MHGTGNDYIYVDCTNNKMLDNPLIDIKLNTDVRDLVVINEEGIIFNGKKLKASTFEKTNDILEENFLIEEVKQKKFMCFMKTRIDNYGMWAMYGGLKKEKGENPKLEDFYVKIKFPVDMIKKFINIIYTRLARRSSRSYINYLRKKGIKIGGGRLFIQRMS